MANIKDKSRVFTRKQIDSLLSAAVGQTLEAVDKAGLFKLHAGREKVKGIAGDIIEVSVLGCNSAETVNVMQIVATYTQHNIQGILPPCTNRNHCFLCDLSFVSQNHKRPNVLRSKIHQRAKDCTLVRCLGHSSELLSSIPS